MLEEILGALSVHILLTYISLFLSIIIGIPLAVISLKNRYLASVIIGFCNLIQAIPSFAVVAIVVPLFGIGFKPAILAIFIRILMPIVKNTYDGLTNIDNLLLDSSKGIGLSEWQILRYIRFPNSYSSIFAGIKFAAILSNSVAILTAIIGSGGLGSIIFEGLASFNINKILYGSIPTILIALFMDISFSIIEYKFFTYPDIVNKNQPSKKLLDKIF
jgi:osmoprotectant transport system permease protein